MLKIANTEGSYIVRAYFEDGTECGSYIVHGDLEDAIATAQTEWCEDQTRATIGDAEGDAEFAEIDDGGHIALAPTAWWEIEIA